LGKIGEGKSVQALDHAPFYRVKSCPKKIREGGLQVRQAVGMTGTKRGTGAGRTQYALWAQRVTRSREIGSQIAYSRIKKGEASPKEEAAGKEDEEGN